MKYCYDQEAEKQTTVLLKTDRSALKFILLTIVTLGIYGIIFYISLSFDIDKIASRHDSKKTPNYLFAYILAFFTVSIILCIWHCHVAERIGDELNRRDINYDFGTSTFWGWGFFGSFIIVGPFIYAFKLCKAMNLLCENYNTKG